MGKYPLIAFGFLFILNTASAAVVENIHVPQEVQQHVNFITKNCEVRTHLTERIEQDKLGGQFYDPLRNVDRIIRSCSNGTFNYSQKVWEDYHEWFVSELNFGGMAPVFTRTKAQAGWFVRTGRFYWSAK